MSFPFRNPPRSTAADPPDTPYARAQQAWDARMGSAVQAAKTWRAMTFGTGALALILGVSLTAVALQKRTYLHVVEVAPEGQVLSVRPAQGAYTPTDAQVSYFLGQFIRLVRNVPTDAVLMREDWLQAYHYLTPQSAQRLNEIARSDDPFKMIGQRARGAMVRSIVQRSPTSWQVSWIEATTNAGGGGSDKVLYTGLFTVAIKPPRDADALTRNPLGIFITDFSWSPDSSPETLYTGAAQ